MMGQVWKIGKWKFGKNWERKMWLYNKLAWPVLHNGVEIWKWKESRKAKREIYMGVRGERKNARLHGQKQNAKNKIKGKDEKKSIRI